MARSLCGILYDLCLQCRYYGEYKNDDIRGFIFEYYEGVSLYKHKEKGKFSEWDVQGLMRYEFSSWGMRETVLSHTAASSLPLWPKSMLAG